MGGPRLIASSSLPTFRRQHLADKLIELSQRSPHDLHDIEALVDFALRRLDAGEGCPAPLSPFGRRRTRLPARH